MCERRLLYHLINRNISSYEVPTFKGTYEGATLSSKLGPIIANLLRTDAFNDVIFTQDVCAQEICAQEICALFSSAHSFLLIHIPSSELTYKESLLMRWPFMVLILASLHLELQ